MPAFANLQHDDQRKNNRAGNRNQPDDLVGKGFNAGHRRLHTLVTSIIRAQTVLAGIDKFLPGGLHAADLAWVRHIKCH